MNMNFTDLPCDIKYMIYKMNREAERDEMYKDAYNEVVFMFNSIMLEFCNGYFPKVHEIVEREP